MYEDVRIYRIPLLPYIKLREEYEVIRASKARTKTDIKKIPVRFTSVNNMYPPNRGGKGRHLSDEGRIYKEYIFDKMAEQDNCIPPSFDHYDCCYVFLMTHEMMYTKSGELKTVDVSNMIKAAEDAVFDYLLDNDCLVTDIHGYKRLTVEDPMLVVLIAQGCESGVVEVNGATYSVSDLSSI